VTVELVFTDGAGQTLKADTVRVAAGGSAVLILPYRELGSRTGGREQIATMVRVDRPGGERIVTLEIFDEATGWTSFGLLLPAVRGFDPQPDPPSQP